MSSTVEWRWPNFTPHEVACRHCGEQYIDERAMDHIQALRDKVGRIHLNSAHRCREHNRREGGAYYSQHLKLAFDVSLELPMRIRKDLLKAALEVGFTGIGLYNSFIHLDLGRPRSWGKASTEEAVLIATHRFENEGLA